MAALRLTIGSDSACDIAYPGASAVAPEHAELVRDAGYYELRSNPACVVLLDGRPAAPIETLSTGSELQFGGSTGPAIRITYVQAGALANYRQRIWAGVAALLALITIFGIWQFDRARRAQFNDTVTKLLLAAPAAEPQKSWAGVLADVRPSVYAVNARGDNGSESVFATAWVVAPGRFVTNAHVGEAIQRAMAEHAAGKFVVRSPVAPFAAYDIVSIAVHPAYDAFRSAWQRYRPQILDASGNYYPFGEPSAYDVAILTVASNASLEPPLRVADEATLFAVRPGDAVAYVGYPAERLLDVDALRPNPRIQTGAIVSLTSYTRTMSAPPDSQLIEHSLPATGGASGSPIVNARGEVIAVLSGGNVFQDSAGRRMPNAALVNFGQRADILRTLLDPSMPFDPVKANARWLEALHRYPGAMDAAKASLARAVGLWQDHDAAPTLLQESEQHLSLQPNTAHLRASALPMRLAAGSYLITALSSNCHDLMMLVATSAAEREASQTLAKSDTPACFAALPFVLTTGENLRVLLVDSSTDLNEASDVHIELLRAAGAQRQSP